MKKKKKKFDAVKMMREIREKLSEKYWQHPEILKKDMEEVRKEYGMNIYPNAAIAAEPRVKYRKK